jgi:type II secretory pathway component PulM
MMLAILASFSAWTWLRDERARLRHGVAVAGFQVREVQNELAEVERLRAETMPAQPSVQSLVAPLANSLRAAKITLSISAADGDRLRVKGVAGFDEAINWLGMIQRDYRLRIVTLVATREASQVTLEATLGTSGP